MRNIFKSIIQKEKDKVFSDYPCSDYLHNALKFISISEPDVAYEEICHALLRSGDKLSHEEEIIFKAIVKKHKIS